MDILTCSDGRKRLLDHFKLPSIRHSLSYQVDLVLASDPLVKDIDAEYLFCND